MEEKSCFNCKNFGTSNPWFVFCKSKKAQHVTFDEALRISNLKENDEDCTERVTCKYWREVK